MEFEKKPNFAFVEFRSFVRFIDKNQFYIKKLSSLFEESSIWFDDCICQKQGFKLFYYPELSTGLKNLYFRNNNFFCKKENKNHYKFATINCSWVDDLVFDWIIQNLEKKEISSRLDKYLSSRKKYTINILFFNLIKKILWLISQKKIYIKNKIKKLRFFKRHT